MGVSVITISGGEPLLHPELDEIIRHIRSHGLIATLITNGYLLTPDRIKRLNRPGLDHLQISIDNVLPDDVSKKSLKVLDRKLQWLAEYAAFQVNINSVLGTLVRHPEDAALIARRARELRLLTTVGIIHDGSGQLDPLNERDRQVYQQLVSIGPKSFSTFAHYNQFQKNLVRGLPNEWHCRAGSRYLYICENGLVHYCSQQRGFPGIPLEQYTGEDLEREYHREKPCAPYCDRLLRAPGIDDRRIPSQSLGCPCPYLSSEARSSSAFQFADRGSRAHLAIPATSYGSQANVRHKCVLAHSTVVPESEMKPLLEGGSEPPIVSQEGYRRWSWTCLGGASGAAGSSIDERLEQ